MYSDKNKMTNTTFYDITPSFSRALDYKRGLLYPLPNFTASQLHTITWHFFLCGDSKTKGAWTKQDLNLIFFYFCTVAYEFLYRCQRQEQQQRQLQKLKQQRCSHNKNRLTHSLTQDSGEIKRERRWQQYHQSH
jgi:hypothetical protein